MIHGVTGVKLIADHISPSLDKFGALETKVRKNASHELKQIVAGHFKKKNEIPNKLGGEKTGFWKLVGKSISEPVMGERKIAVKINSPHAAIHVHGGTIKPKGTNAKTHKPLMYLTIPIHAMAHGKRAGLFKLHRVGKVLMDDQKVKLFVLAKKATIPKDPTALPDPKDAKQKIERIIRITVERS